MKYLILFTILVLVLTGLNTETHLISGKPALKTFADSLFKANVDSSKIAGASVLVFQKGEMLLDKSYGYASLELSAPMPDHASFEIGSVTKQFTAAAILRLVEQGKLALSDDFTKYVPFDTKGRTITISQLLNHTSGISSYTEIGEFENFSKLSFDRDTLVRIIEKKDFLFEPGEALIYNNSGYFLLGLIIEKVSGASYSDYLHEQFFKPLEMTNTYYCSNSVVVKNKAYGYSYSEDGLQQKDHLDHTWPFAAGSLCSTTSDLLKWMTALHHGKVFDKKLYTLMTTPGKLNDGSPLRYAMGITNFDLNGNKLIGHGGGINGFLSETFYFPNDDLYVICLVNTTGPAGASYFAGQLTWRVLTKKEEESRKLDVAVKTLVGTYSGQARGRTLSVDVSESNNRLILKTSGRDGTDTLKTYLGNNIWARASDRILIRNGKMHIDNVGGHYVLGRQ